MKYLKYLKYIIVHKWYVMIECFKCGLYYQGIMHDISKFKPSEFIAYTNYFYGDSKNRDEFELSWLKHQKVNPHHWQYWILHNDDGSVITLKMPDKYIIEMICDWIGAGKAQGKKQSKDDRFFETRKWYNKNSENMLIHGKTAKEISKILHYERII